MNIRVTKIGFLASLFAASQDLSMPAERRKMGSKVLALDHDRPQDFAESEWQFGRPLLRRLYVAYRWLLALSLLSALVLNVVEIRTLKWPRPLVRRAKWPIYLTNWGFVLLTAQAALAAVIATRHAVGRTASRMTVLHKTYWVCNNLANDLAPGITFGYWAIVYNPKIHVIDFDNVAVHMLNSIIVLIDIFVCGHPIKLQHIYQPIILGVTYSTFTALYYFAGGTSQLNGKKLYPILDWSKPQWAILVSLGSCIVLVITHFLMWLLFLIRRKIRCCLFGNKYRINNSSLNLENVVAVNEIPNRRSPLELELIFVVLLLLILKPLNGIKVG